jgi:Arc/MetJ family transcription regulator
MQGWVLRQGSIESEHQTMLYWVLETTMRTTLALDDDLVQTAQEFTGVVEKTALVRMALKALIEREASTRLAALEGTMPRLEGVPRRRGNR